MNTQYEVGKWYYFENKDFKWIARFRGTVGIFWEHSEIYYTNGKGSIGAASSSTNENYCKGLATPQQIETCFRAYAEKNGYLEGTFIKPEENCNVQSKVGFNNLTLYDKGNDSFTLLGANVYYKGKWAEIVKEEPKKEINMVKVGIQIDGKWLNDGSEYVTGNRLIKEEPIVFSGALCLGKNINPIPDKYNLLVLDEDILKIQIQTLGKSFSLKDLLEGYKKSLRHKEDCEEAYQKGHQYYLGYFEDWYKERFEL